MNENDLKHYMNQRLEGFLKQYRSSADKYEGIWKVYQEKMPTCIAQCDQLKERYSGEPYRDGPQGIYWIGANPEIFFVGRDHYGWYGDAEWPRDIECICHAPLEFAYFTVPSMGAYWGILKGLIGTVLEIEAYDWYKLLPHVALSNACKCLTDRNSYQYHLHENCERQGYLEMEIMTVRAPLNVLFTRSYNLSDRLFDGALVELYRDDEFIVSEYGLQRTIECAHPGRLDRKWRERLAAIMKEYKPKAA